MTRRRCAVARSSSCSTPAASGRCPTPPTTATRAPNTLGAPRRGGRRARRCRRSARSGSADHAARPASPAAAAPAVHGRLHPSGRGKDSTTGHWELMGVVRRRRCRRSPTASRPRWSRALERGHRARASAATAAQRPRGDRRLRRAAPAERRADPLHVAGLGAAARRARGRRAAEPSCYAACAAVARDHDRRARRRPRDRAAVRAASRARSAHRRAARLRAAAARRARTWTSCRRPASPVHAVGKVARPVRGRGIDAEHTGRDERARRSRDDARLHRRARQRPRLHEPRRDRPGLRPSQGRRGLPRARCARSTRRSAAWLGAAGPEATCWCLTADHGCDPRTAHTDHTREHVPLLARLRRRTAARRHDGPMADVGATRRCAGWPAATRAGARPGTPFACALPSLGAMPELPEVETIRRQLAPAGRGARRSRTLEILDPRWCGRSRPRRSRDAVEGRRVERLRRRGKYLDLRARGRVVPAACTCG